MTSIPPSYTWIAAFAVGFGLAALSRLWEKHRGARKAPAHCKADAYARTALTPPRCREAPSCS
ncbi:MAG TPA: hypothetical protein VFQ35_02385 [Polyangiaceae bacterium]|nr:hypothetical protein [Polyangiaceae bacterium]